MIKRIPAQFARGFAMGAADVVPGVSGGTVALLLGIYDRLIHNVREGAGVLAHAVRGDTKGATQRFKSIEWSFLLPLFAGIVTAVVVLVSFLRTQVENHPVEVSAVFFGFVAASVIVAAPEVERWDALRFVTAVVVAVAAFVGLGLRSGSTEDPALLLVFAAGSVAICAMILPGISGAFILLMLGMYDPVTKAVDERDLAVIAVFGVGAVVGLALFSTALNWMLEHHRNTVMAALIGLMAGSLRVLWPWPVGEGEGTHALENVELAAPVSGDLPGAVLGAVIAAIVVVFLGALGRRHRPS